ncbi:MAG: aspartate/glutamate racemase family protein [Candidatus Scalindua sp.]|jgi:glutamate racemase|nr:aspartate/glutamate racemase family protein [Candidatus Scalindua sp.]MDV5166055.1 aspartate/glutamate racemase family protein [Candidatus Scalindua sp.]
MSIDHTKQQSIENFPELSTLGKIHSRIDKVKLIIQDKDVDFFDKHCHLFKRLEGLRQKFIDTINLKMDDGSTKTVKLFLVQHNLAFGPGQGELKFITHVDLPEEIKKVSLVEIKDIVENIVLEEVESSAVEKSLFHALHNVKLGGASSAIMLLEIEDIRGEIKAVPINLTKSETIRLAREVGSRLVKYRIMGPDGFWPEPDNETTDEQIVNWIEDEALNVLRLKQLLAPKDKELIDTLGKVHEQVDMQQQIQGRKNATMIHETPYHDVAIMWLKEWRATRRGKIAMEELNSEESKVSKQYRQLISRTERKYDVMPSIAKDIIAVKRLLTVMHSPFRDFRPNGQIVIMDTGIAPVILHEHLSKLEDLSSEDVVVASVFSKRLGGSSPERIDHLCRTYVEAAYNLGAKVVLLCNTMDANARAMLEKEFSIHILGPIVPAVEAILRAEKANGMKVKNIGIVATKATIESGAYIDEIRKHRQDVKIFSIAAPLFATMVDMSEFDKMGSQVISPRNLSIIDANLKPLMDENIDLLILGCTHYGIFKQMILEIWKSRTGKEIHIVDSSKELSDYALTFLKQNKILSLRVVQKGKVSYIASGEDAPVFERKVSEITGCLVDVVPIDIGEVVGRLSGEDRLFQKTVAKESREDVNLRAGIINSNLSAETKITVADKLYGVKDKGANRPGCEILSPELKEGHIEEITRLTTQNEELLKILSHIKNATSQ